MVARQLGGMLPQPGAFSDADKAILAAADAMIGKAREAMKTQELHHVLAAVWAVVADANRYFAGEAPWALAKTDPVRQGTVLYVTAEVIRQVAILTQPFMPTRRRSCSICWQCRPTNGSSMRSAASAALPSGVPLPAPSPVFPRYVESEGSAQT